MLIRQTGTVLFGPARGVGPLELNEKLFLPRPIVNFVAGVSGFSAAYSDSDSGRPFGRLIVDLFKTEVVGNELTLSFRFGLRDLSGNWDDTYQGLIDFTALVEIADENDIGDAIKINAVEYNQAIQFFRTEQDLDPPNQMPNNSIPLIEGKATAIRVYADFNPPDELQEGDRYIGELEVTSSSGSTVLNELFGDVTPGRDTVETPLSSGQVPHFVLPAEQSRSGVKLRGRLSVERPGGALEVGWSPWFETRLDFSVQTSPQIFLVGFNYLGDPNNDLDGPADPPTQDEAEALFDRALQMFPIPGIDFTGFQIEDIEGPGAEQAFEHRIFDTLRDVRGDALEEKVYGVFGVEFDAFIPSSENTILGGSALAEDSIAWSGAGAGQFTAAHELGHLFGRRHAPGDSDTQPADIDQGFPSYGSYPWGSIGQHGIDTGVDIVGSGIKSPAGYYDIMGYSSNYWISPYTYTGLITGTQPPPPGIAPGGSVAFLNAPPPRRLGDILFLTVLIRRDRSVERLPSFHFPAPFTLPPAARSGFEVELADDCRNTLVCQPLADEPVGRSCWPRRLTGRIPFAARARWLLIWEGDRLIYEECIAPAPRLDLICESQSAGLNMSWSSDPEDGVWYLVHWQGVDGKWRGLGLRSQRRSVFLPGALGGAIIGARVLATSGIATTISTCAEPRRLIPRSFTIDVRPRFRARRRGAARVVAGWTASVRDETGRIASDAILRWFDQGGQGGRAIGSGRYLDADRLPPETTTVTVVVRNRFESGGTVRRTLEVHRAEDGPRLVAPAPPPSY